LLWNERKRGEREKRYIYKEAYRGSRRKQKAIRERTTGSEYKGIEREKERKKEENESMITSRTL
jgi:hypothetical protein